MKTKEAIERVRNRFDKWGLDEEDLRALRALGLVSIESEDERIWKRLIEQMERWHEWALENNAVQDIKDSADAITYLEKQKEPEWCHHKVDLSGCSEEYRKAYYDGWNNCNLQYSQLQAEQKLAEWEPGYREEDLQTRFAFYTYKDEPDVLYLSNLFVEEASRGAHFGTRILKGAEKLAESIGASTIRLKVKQDSPANAWYRKNGYGYMTFEDGYDWLEKKLEYLKPNKPAEWSEEDEHYINAIVCLCKGEYVSEGSKLQILSWLKSLCPHWKPSEEQMEELDNARHNLIASCDILTSLYEQLKKL